MSETPTLEDIYPERVVDIASLPAPKSASAPGGSTLMSVLAESRCRLDSIKAYRLKMNLQERVNGTLNPAEDVVLNIRRNPKAVRIEWPTGPNKGREVIYAADANSGLMYIHMPNPLIPQIKMAPDSPLATRNSRHPITEAGFDTIIEDMENAARRQVMGDPGFGVIKYVGLIPAEGLNRHCHKIERVTPNQESWVVFLEPESYLPVLVQATAKNGDLLERYTFRDLRSDLPELTMADAFDPVVCWGPAKGLLQRFSGASTGPEIGPQPH